MKKIAIMGLYNYENMGDQLICQSVKYIIEQLDGQYECELLGFQPERVGEKFEYYRKNRKDIVEQYEGELLHKEIYKNMELFVRDYYRDVLKDKDALIFSVGSFKYGTQDLWSTYSLAIEVAKEYQIPVMFNGMNIQKSDESDWRCQCLKKHANFDNVWMISSRDGIAGVERLKREYIENSKVKLRAVGDPAFIANKCYPQPNRKENNIVGINLIREGIFEDYGLAQISDQELFKFYKEIIDELDSKKIEWELFTNGMGCDLKFGEKLLEFVGKKEKKIQVPRTPKELMEIVAQYDMVIGARLHACIVAYSLEIPFVGYYWDEKLKHFAEGIESEKYFCNQNELKGEIIVQKLLEAKKNRLNYKIKQQWIEKNAKTIQEFLQML